MNLEVCIVLNNHVHTFIFANVRTNVKINMFNHTDRQRDRQFYWQVG